MEIFFLGTSGSIPTLKRNLPSLVLRREGKLYLFDCGEAAQIQIIRSGLSLAKFHSVFISHMHGDHVTGLPGFLMLLTQADRRAPLYIYGPKGIADFVNSIKRTLNFYNNYEIIIEEISEEKRIIEAKDFYIETAFADHNIFTLSYQLQEYPRPGKFHIDKAKALGIEPGPIYKELQSGESIQIGDKIIEPKQVLGPPRPGRKFVYAVDTRPSGRIIEFSNYADLLVHDGMFLSDEEVDAASKGHSTAAQAAHVALLANVKQLILTHISSRYFNSKPLMEEAREIFPNTTVAYDLLHITVPFSDEDGSCE